MQTSLLTVHNAPIARAILSAERGMDTSAFSHKAYMWRKQEWILSITDWINNMNIF